jgi:hypothetical protein
LRKTAAEFDDQCTQFFSLSERFSQAWSHTDDLPQPPTRHATSSFPPCQDARFGLFFACEAPLVGLTDPMLE